jgi:hypothetical protein
VRAVVIEELDHRYRPAGVPADGTRGVLEQFVPVLFHGLGDPRGLRRRLPLPQDLPRAGDDLRIVKEIGADEFPDAFLLRCSERRASCASPLCAAMRSRATITLGTLMVVLIMRLTIRMSEAGRARRARSGCASRA